MNETKQETEPQPSNWFRKTVTGGSLNAITLWKVATTSPIGCEAVGVVTSFFFFCAAACAEVA